MMYKLTPYYKTGKQLNFKAMLPYSNKPQILRLHEIEQKQRNKFSTHFASALTELLPSTTNRILKSSLFLMKLLMTLPDIYYTLVTVYFCKRRLGEEYTYIAMYKSKIFLQQGALLNKKTRLLLFLLEIISRNVISPLISKFMNSNNSIFDYSMICSKSQKYKLWEKILFIGQKIKQRISTILGNAEDIMSNVEWLVLMVYMLDWNKHFSFIETLLGIRYIYTYKNDQIREVSYTVEGYLLLATFLIKTGKYLFSIFQSKAKLLVQTQTTKNYGNYKSIIESKQKDNSLCRICYEELKNRSSTKCGHVFCWLCIIKTLEITQQCPVCRSNCLPREVVQIRNI